jgi:hypothetical protein
MPMYWDAAWLGLSAGLPAFFVGAFTQQAAWSVVAICCSAAGWAGAVKLSRRIYATHLEVVWRGGFLSLVEQRTPLVDIDEIVLEDSLALMGVSLLLRNVAPGVQDMTLVTRRGLIKLYQVPDAASVRDILLGRRDKLRGAPGGVA